MERFCEFWGNGFENPREDLRGVGLGKKKRKIGGAADGRAGKKKRFGRDPLCFRIGQGPTEQASRWLLTGCQKPGGTWSPVLNFFLSGAVATHTHAFSPWRLVLGPCFTGRWATRRWLGVLCCQLCRGMNRGRGQRQNLGKRTANGEGEISGFTRQTPPSLRYCTNYTSGNFVR